MINNKNKNKGQTVKVAVLPRLYRIEVIAPGVKRLVARRGDGFSGAIVRVRPLPPEVTVRDFAHAARVVGGRVATTLVSTPNGRGVRPFGVFIDD